MGNYEPSGLLNRGKDGRVIDWRELSQVNNLDADTLFGTNLGRL